MACGTKIKKFVTSNQNYQFVIVWFTRKNILKSDLVILNQI